MSFRRQLVTGLAVGIASGKFVAMLNPKYRGRAFDYRAFDVERYVMAMIGTSLPTPPSKRELALAAEVARHTWDHWLELAGDGVPTR